MTDNWNYEYGGVKKRTIWSKTKLVLNALWFIPYLSVFLVWYYFFGDKNEND